MSERMMHDALALAVRWMGDPADPLGTFEDVADWFYGETGYLRPGKSEPMECGDRTEEREAAWKAWATRTRTQVRATCLEALRQSPAPGDVHAHDGALQHVALGYLARAEKAEAECARLRAALVKLARWIGHESDSRTDSRGTAHRDHACGRCIPGGPIVDPAFTCAVHIAEDVLDAALTPPKETER